MTRRDLCEAAWHLGQFILISFQRSLPSCFTCSASWTVGWARHDPFLSKMEPGKAGLDMVLVVGTVVTWHMFVFELFSQLVIIGCR